MQQGQRLKESLDHFQQTGSSSEFANFEEHGRILTNSILFEIEKDIEQFFKDTKCMEQVPRHDFSSHFNEIPVHHSDENLTLLEQKKKSLLNLILSFLVYRPDVGYVKVSTLFVFLS